MGERLSKTVQFATESLFLPVRRYFCCDLQCIAGEYRKLVSKLNGELHPKPKLSIFCAPFQNDQHCYEKQNEQ